MGSGPRSFRRAGVASLCGQRLVLRARQPPVGPRAGVGHADLLQHAQRRRFDSSAWAYTRRTPGRASASASSASRALGGVALAPRIGAQAVAQLDLSRAHRRGLDLKPAHQPAARALDGAEEVRPGQEAALVLAQRSRVRREDVRRTGRSPRVPAAKPSSCHQRVEVRRRRAGAAAGVRSPPRAAEPSRRAGRARQPPANAERAARRRPVPTNNRRRPTLPGPCGPSTIGAEGLNCSVRNGKRCFPLAMTTGIWARPRPLGGPSKPHSATPGIKKNRQALGPLVPVSFAHCCASRSGLSTWWSTRVLTPSRGWESSSRGRLPA